MRLIYLVILALLSACQIYASTTEISLAHKQWCEDAGLRANSEECITYINTINQRTQQEHLLELQRQGVPVQYDKCVQSLPIDAVYKSLSQKTGISEKEVRAFIPEGTINDFAKCTCSDMIYNGLTPDDAIQKCQTTITSDFLSKTKDTQLEFCIKTTLIEIRQEYKKQNVAFDEKTLKDKYSKDIINYCNCVSETKEEIVLKYQSTPMDQKIKLAEKAVADCAEKHLIFNNN